MRTLDLRAPSPQEVLLKASASISVPSSVDALETKPTKCTLPIALSQLAPLSFHRDPHRSLAAAQSAHRAPAKSSSKTSGEPTPRDRRRHQKAVSRVLKALCKATTLRDRYMDMAGAHVQARSAACPSSQRSMNLSEAARRTIVDRLRLQVQPDQRSAAWHAARRHMITASDFGKLLKTPASRTTFAWQKARAIREARAAPADAPPPARPTGAACQHGVLFEPVCDLVYREVCRPGAITEEFGLLCHPQHAYIGASPDGICNADSRPAAAHVGRLTEYKAPPSRALRRGRVPEGYLAQMQGQLEVTGLDECDYLECVFRTQTREAAYQRRERDAMAAEDMRSLEFERLPPSSAHTERARRPLVHGVLLEFPSGLRRPPVLGPLGDVADKTVLGLLAGLDPKPSESSTENVVSGAAVRDAAMIRYWWLEDFQLITVRRNRDWFDTVLFPQLQDTWTQMNRFVQDDAAYAAEETRRAGRKRGGERGKRCRKE